MARGDRGTVPVEQVREHVRALQKANMPNRAIAAAAGLSFSTFNSVMYSLPKRSKRKHVTAATAEALLSVPVPPKPLPLTKGAMLRAAQRR
ncbi:hypothetical protein [Nocardia pseudovaccinii]|uniref:hypothetical protein n=1 Tax=Nocardia pseudovaccinii TaxID=189540 RepID=UPI0007A42D6E|nr:hypothetical protein [Nocardia pseudovaccinii]